MSDACIFMKEMRNTHNIFIRKPERKKPLGRSRYRWEDNNRMDGVDWIHLAQDREQWQRALVITVMNLRFS
jgi:hypothetical protein